MKRPVARRLWGRRRALALLAAALAPGLYACGPTPIPDRRRELLRSWCEDFLGVRYREFTERALELDTAARALAAEPSGPEVQQARTAWSRARRPFKEAEVFAFGPAIEEPLRYAPKIDFWPVRPDDVEQSVAGTDPIDAARLGASAKGLPAIEYLLFAPNAPEQLRSDPRRREFLSALTGDLVRQARGLAAAWDPAEGDFQSELVEAGTGSTTFDTLPMALSEVVNRMAFLIETIRANKLEAGLALGGHPAPEKLESRFSERSIADILDNLRGIELLYFGDAEQGIAGLDALLVRRGRSLGPTVRAALETSRAALRQLDPLTEAVRDDAPGVRSAASLLATLQRIIQVDVLGALSLSVRFSDNDGD